MISRALTYLDRHRVSLELIGWEDTDPQSDVPIDLQEHREAILEALWSALNYGDDDLREGMLVEAERAEAGEPPRDETLTERVLALRAWAAAIEAQASALAPSRPPVTVYSSAEVGRAVRARRRNLELPKKHLAELTGLNRTAVSELERDGNAHWNSRCSSSTSSACTPSFNRGGHRQARSSSYQPRWWTLSVRACIASLAKRARRSRPPRSGRIASSIPSATRSSCAPRPRSCAAGPDRLEAAAARSPPRSA